MGPLRGMLSRKGAGRDHRDGGRGRNGNGVRLEPEQLLPNKSSRFPVVKSALTLCIEHSVTADMADGQPLPPYTDDGIVWHVARRTNGRTLWRRLVISSSSPLAEWRAAPGDQTRAP